MLLPNKNLKPFGGRTGGMRVIRMLPWLLIAPLFLLPLGSAIRAAWGGGLDPGAFFSWWSRPSVRSSAWFSLAQASLSALLALALGLPGAFILARYRFRFRRFFMALSSLPFVFPPVLFTLGFLRIWGNNGAVNSVFMQVFGLAEPPLQVAYSFAGVVLAHGLFNFPLVTGLVSASLGRKSRAGEDAARSLGAGELRIFFTITLPLMLPGIMAAVSLVFLYCFLSFAIPLALGGGPGMATLEVSIYAAVSGTQDFGAALSIAALELVFALAALGVWVWFRREPGTDRERMNRHADQAGSVGGESLVDLKGLKSARKKGVRIWLFLSALLATSPALALVWSSFTVQGRPGFSEFPSLGSWQKIISQPEYLSALANSALVGVLAGALSCLLALLILAGESRGGGGVVRTVFFGLPVALSAVMLSLGYLLLFPSGGNPVILVLVQATAGYPLAYRGMAVARSRINQSLEDAAAVLGAGPWWVWLTIDARIMRPAILSSWALCTALSLGEINAALMLNLKDFPLLGLSAYRLMAAYQYPLASALGVLVCLLSGLAFAWAEKLTPKE